MFAILGHLLQLNLSKLSPFVEKAGEKKKNAYIKHNKFVNR